MYSSLDCYGDIGNGEMLVHFKYFSNYASKGVA